MHKQVGSLIALGAISMFALAAEDDRSAHQHDHGHHESAPAANDAPIQIAINPETRVSVTRGGNVPPPAACGRPIELPVKITNRGFLTAPLEATLVDNVPAGVSIEFAPKPLSGAVDEMRSLRVTLRKAELVDVTVSFRAKNDIPDLGGRDRIHLLLRCL